MNARDAHTRCSPEQVFAFFYLVYYLLQNIQTMLTSQHSPKHSLGMAAAAYFSFNNTCWTSLSSRVLTVINSCLHCCSSRVMSSSQGIFKSFQKLEIRRRQIWRVRLVPNDFDVFFNLKLHPKNGFVWWFFVLEKDEFAISQVRLLQCLGREKFAIKDISIMSADCGSLFGIRWAPGWCFSASKIGAKNFHGRLPLTKFLGGWRVHMPSPSGLPFSLRVIKRKPGLVHSYYLSQESMSRQKDLRNVNSSLLFLFVQHDRNSKCTDIGHVRLSLIIRAISRVRDPPLHWFCRR